ncbi:ORF6N domain-containing protein [Erwinia amylovora]|uniref:ORF6N domain-containing protein n=1 Tax=Erwinia amylovora TaxID=552 RepID=UPI000C08094C|nr:ORF6N domain-containing protein [Erwinia amylovora]
MRAITVHAAKMPLVEYQGQRVVTFSMIDTVHQRPKDTARKAFNRNRRRFVEGRHFFELTASVLCTQSFIDLFPSRTSRGIVITEMGYLLLVKPFNDDLAWQVQEQVVEAYFRPVPAFADIRPVLIPSLDELEAMPPQQAQNILAAAERKSHWRHGKHGSAEMSQRKRELKTLRPALARIAALIQLTIPGLEIPQ